MYIIVSFVLVDRGVSIVCQWTDSMIVSDTMLVEIREAQSS